MHATDILMMLLLKLTHLLGSHTSILPTDSLRHTLAPKVSTHSRKSMYMQFWSHRLEVICTDMVLNIHGERIPKSCNEAKNFN